MQTAKESIIISSPRICRKRVLEFLHKMKELAVKAKIIVYTLPAEAYREEQRNSITKMKAALKKENVEIIDVQELNCHYVVLDEELVWYGSMNFLSLEHDEDILMRIRNEAIAEELMDFLGMSENK